MDLVALNEKILEEGFELLSISGAFHVEPFTYKGKQFIAFDEELAMPMRFGQDFAAVKQLASNYTHLRFAEGKVVKQPGADSFSFILQRT